MSPELENALKKAKAGDIIGPLNLQDYFYIVRVEKIEKVKPNTKAEEIDENQVKQILIQKKLANLTRAYVKKLREKAYISIKNFAEKR
jgi:parvulin-like peptidyl-prolyl isomerase